MIESNAKLTYALKDGQMVHVDDVPTGNACECICPSCHGKLCAKNTSDIRTHHFAHVSGEECEGALESAIHRLAKEILVQTKCIKLPNKALYLFQKVTMEQIDSETNLRPDCIGIHNGKKVWIEFAFTHKTDPQKITSIVSKKIECIEIDISDCTLDREQLENFIIKSPEKRMWIYSNNYEVGALKRPNSNVHGRGEGRHCAINAKGELIDITRKDVVCRYDFDLNPCKCIVCDKPLLLSMDPFGGYQFCHQGEHPECEDEEYFSKLAGLVLRNRIRRDHNLNLNIPIKKECSNFKNCPFTSKKYCFDYLPETYLLEIKEDEIKEVVTLEANMHNQHKDILVTKGRSTIRFIFNTRNYGHPKIEENDGKIIEFIIRNERQALQIDSIEFVPNEPYLSFHNFGWQIKELHQYCNVFIAFSTHRYTLEKVQCPSKDVEAWKNSRSVVKKIYFNNDVDQEQAIRYGLSYCRNNDIMICPCLLCRFLQEETGECLKYWDEGTPLYPLDPTEPDSFPDECTCFEEKDSTPDYSIISNSIRRID